MRVQALPLETTHTMVRTFVIPVITNVKMWTNKLMICAGEATYAILSPLALRLNDEASSDAREGWRGPKVSSRTKHHLGAQFP